MKKLILLPFAFLSIASNAQIDKVEHFFVSSPDANRLFNLFKDSFQLPVVWNFQKFTDFASGGVTLGNVVIEFLVRDGVTETKFGGIAFEPRQHLNEFIAELDKKGIDHDTIENKTSITPNGTAKGWSNLTLRGLLLPTEARIFICDYANREQTSRGRNKAADSLKFRNGGVLGIIGVRELIIGTKELKKHTKEISKLPGVVKETKNLFSFGSGPSIRLTKYSKPSIQKIVIKVKSIAVAKAYLDTKKLLGKTTRTSIFIDATAIDGLKIELVE